MSSKNLVKIHAVLRKLWSYAQLLMCPIGHVPHPPRYPISIFNINHDIPLPMSHCPCPYVKKDVKLSKKMSSCQKDVKLSKRCQMSKSQTHGLWRRLTKKINWHNEVHTYWCQFWCHIWWWPKTLKMCIESVFEQFWWPSYLTSKLMSLCVNLIMWINFFLHSLCVWLFDIWHLFDILTSFNLNHLSPSQGYFYYLDLHFLQFPIPLLFAWYQHPQTPPGAPWHPPGIPTLAPPTPTPPSDLT